MSFNRRVQARLVGSGLPAKTANITVNQVCRSGIHESLAVVPLTEMPCDAVRVIVNLPNEVVPRANRVRAIKNAGLYPIPCIKTHAFASDAEWVAGLQTFVDTIGNKSDVIECGNEPPALDPYLRRLRLGAPIIRAAGKRVILSHFIGVSGGFSAAKAALDAGTLASWADCDDVAIHPYTQSAIASYESIWSYRNSINSSGGAGKPLWVTECGWPTFTGNYIGQQVTITEEVQAQRITSLFNLVLPDVLPLKLRGLVIFCGANYGLPSAGWGNHCGTYQQDGTPKLGAAALAAAPRRTYY